MSMKKLLIIIMLGFLQKCLVIVLILTVCVLIVNFVGRGKKNERILLMIMNVSRSLDKLDAGLDVINNRTELAKEQFKKLIELHLNYFPYTNNQQAKLKELKNSMANSTVFSQSTDSKKKST